MTERTLLYVPVIHIASDLGSLAPQLDRRSAEICGEERWAAHKEIIARFWEGIEVYFRSIDAADLKIFQDGLISGGEFGKRIIEQGARTGSQNYRIVRDLVERGALIQKTEDIALIQEEYERLLRSSQSPSRWDSSTAQIGYEHEDTRLMERRDRFVAEAIHVNLKDGERGALFMGAFHKVYEYLNRSIRLITVKDPSLVREYFSALLTGADEERFSRLAEYMIRAPK